MLTIFIYFYAKCNSMRKSEYKLNIQLLKIWLRLMIYIHIYMTALDFPYIFLLIIFFISSENSVAPFNNGIIHCTRLRIFCLGFLTETSNGDIDS